MSSPNIVSPLTNGASTDNALSPGYAPQNLTGPRANPAFTGNPALTNAAAPPKPAPQEEVVVPPQDAKWTIFCTVISGPGHSIRAAQIKSRLADATRSNKWYVVHEDVKSTLYHGFYRSIERGTPDGDRAQLDKDTISRLKDSTGEAPLRLCSFLQIDRPAPAAPAEWDLANVGRSELRYWSLQIGAYTADGTAERPGDVADRKSAAVESVKALRAQGIPAYYYHGDAVSSICVGIWPMNALKRQGGGNKAGNAEQLNPNEPLFVANALPSNTKEVRGPDGKLLKPVTPRVEILDENMLQTVKQYPRHLLNGYEMKHEQKGQVWFDSSFLVLVPETKQNVAGSQQPNSPELNALPLLPASALGGDVAPAPRPGTGRLREAQ